MTPCSLSVIFLVVTQGTALNFSRKGRYIPNLKIAEEIDISDVTFTTPATDSVYVASVTNPKLSQRNKPRIIIPVVAYHKSSHPPSQLITDTLYNGRKPRKFKFIPLTRGVNDVIGQGLGYKVSQAPNYRRYNAPQKTRPVYYLVGDEPAGPGNMPETLGCITKKSFSLLNRIKGILIRRHTHPLREQIIALMRDLRSMRTKQILLKIPRSGLCTQTDPDCRTEGLIFRFALSQMVGQSADNMPSQKGDRVEFQMYGMDGPHSYKFGYDTGKGFEERDSDGKIRGHYGYMDNEGKMRVMKYEADPETGFHAGPVDLSSGESS